MILTMDSKILCVGTNFSSQLMVREAIVHSFCCEARQSDGGKEVGCLGLDDNVSGSKHAIGELMCCSSVDREALRLDLTLMLHTHGSSLISICKLRGAFTLSLCVLLPSTTPKHNFGELYNQ